jgi:TRAP-type C4-dicarboxylate transport system permease small subunit
MAGFDKTLDRLIDACGVVAMTAITLAGIVITTDVAMRGTGLGVVYGGTEIVEYLVFVTAFYSAPWVLKLNGHIRIDIVLQVVPRKVARALEVIADVVGILVVMCILFYTVRIGLQSFGEGRRVFRTFFFPEWWIYAAAALALSLLWLEFVRRTLRSVTGRLEESGLKSW